MRLQPRLSVAFVIAAAASWGLVRPAAAQEANPSADGKAEGLPETPAAGLDDKVVLKAGGFVRGTIVVSEPGNEVVILVPGSGEIRIPWGDVERVEQGGVEEDVSPPPLPTPAPEPVAPPPPPDAVVGPRLTIEADDDGVRIYRESGLIGRAATGELVCDPPCDTVIDLSKPGRYYFAGDGIDPSDKFSLRGQRGALTARVDAAPSSLWLGGVIVMTAGIVTTLGGASMFISQAVASGQSNVQTAFDLNITGGIAVGVGAGAIAGGIAMILFSETKVQWLRDGREVELGMSGLAYRF